MHLAHLVSRPPMGKSGSIGFVLGVEATSRRPGRRERVAQRRSAGLDVVPGSGELRCWIPCCPTERSTAWEDAGIRQSIAAEYRAKTMPFPGGTDTRYFAMAGTPAVVYEPGSLEQAHALDEFVPIADLSLADRHLRTVVTFLGIPHNPRRAVTPL
jgi:hypothetical protein